MPARRRYVEPAAATEADSRPRGGGLEYAHYLIPRQNDARPGLTQVVALQEAWLRGGYIAAPGSAALQRINFNRTIWSETASQTGATLLKSRVDFKAAPVPLDAAVKTELADADFRLTWPIETAWTAGLKYPLDHMPRTPRGGEGPGFNLEIHSLGDYVYLTSDLVAAYPNIDPASRPVACKVSGTNLHYAAERVANMFDLMGSRIRHTCPTCSTIFKPQERSVAVKDGWTAETRQQPGGATYRFAIVIDCGKAVPENSPTVTPEFKALSEAALGQPLYEVGTAY